MGSFSTVDADAFFLSNRDAMTHPRDDIALPLLRLYGIQPTKVLDVGCSNGHRLAAVCEALNCEGWGCDLSSAAIRDGQERWPGLWLKVGAADSIPFPLHGADLALAVFVFHWIGRPQLLESVAEIDRVLQPGAYLLMADFASDQPEAVPYKHAPGLYTVKQPYHELFTASLGYRLVAYLEFDHDSRELRPDVPSSERAFKALLRKAE